MLKIQPFDQYFKKYESWFTENKYVYQSELAAVGNFIPKAGKGVEIGIGSGQFSVPFGIQLGIDPSKSMLELVKKKRLKVVRAVAEYLPF